MKRTGLKIFYRKLRSNLMFPHLNSGLIPTAVPKKGLSSWKMRLWLYSLLNEIDEIKLGDKFGASYSKPENFVIKVWSKVLAKNPNNLGNWLTNSSEVLTGTPRAENELLSQLIKLLGGKSEDWTGYITSGSTEANIFSTWIGRNYLRRRMSKGKVVMILNNLTHYSISKAADILDLEIEYTSINQDWKTDIPCLLDKIKALKKKGYKSFLIPLTLGYTQTGTNDDLAHILLDLNKLQETLHVQFFVWVDAASNGLTLPFTESGFYPLKYDEINTITLDFHKTGMCPIPSGIVLYRHHLQKHIAKGISYIKSDDTSLLGSRSGAAAAGMLALLDYKGVDGLKKHIYNQIKQKNIFIEKIKHDLKGIQIVNEPNSLSFGIVSKTPVPELYLSKYGLYSKKKIYQFPKKNEKYFIYKASFY